jgi:hypothetical protein
MHDSPPSKIKEQRTKNKALRALACQWQWWGRKSRWLGKTTYDSELAADCLRCSAVPDKAKTESAQQHRNSINARL